MELHGKCLRQHTEWLEKAKPTGEGLETANKWRASLDAQYEKCLENLDTYLQQHEDQEQDPPQYPEEVDDGIEQLELQIRDRTRRLADELEDSRLEEARRAEDIRRNAQREQLDLEFKLDMARARRVGPTSSTPTGGERRFTLPPGSLDQTTAPRKRSYITMKSTDGDNSSTMQQSVDAWIYEPFTTIAAGAEGQTLVTMAMIPNLKPFSGDPRDWPMFIQAFKSMVHDVFASDAQRLAMLHTMLDSKLRVGMSQILSTPTAYQQALQELRRKYGHPHFVVRAYIQGLMALSPFQGGEALEDFSIQLHGAATTLEMAGYGHELDSSVALEGLVMKLPDTMIARWGRQVNRLLPGIPTLRDLDSWLEDQVMGQKNVRRMDNKSTRDHATTTEVKKGGWRPYQPTNEKRWQPNPTPSVNAIETPRYGGGCAVCEAQPGHKLEGCQKFMAMSPTQRAQTIWDIRNCFRCLGRNHHSNACKKIELVCTVGSCKGKHHTLLHGAESVATFRTASRNDGRRE